MVVAAITPTTTCRFRRGFLLSQFNASGAFESVDCQIAGLGEVPSIQELYVAHTKAAIDSLNG
mgnify:CR=1 FL=1